MRFIASPGNSLAGIGATGSPPSTSNVVNGLGLRLVVSEPACPLILAIASGVEETGSPLLSRVVLTLNTSFPPRPLSSSASLNACMRKSAAA